jgi:hypothetical protein
LRPHALPLRSTTRRVLQYEPPGSGHLWQTLLDLGPALTDAPIVALRVVNPLPNGKPLRFANADQDRHATGWLSVGKITRND